ncbi:MAG: inorganic phosphate transporter [Thermodesulfobacteriota bacterium]
MEINIFVLIFLIIGIVLLYEFINGFNDCANMVVTPIITGALEPRQALLILAIFEFIGAWFLGTAVAKTLGLGIVNPAHITILVILAALFSAIIWILNGWYLGMPSSSSHALIGGLLGAVIMQAGTEAIHWGTVIKVILMLISTPLLGLGAGYLLTKNFISFFAGFKPSQANRLLKRLQIVTSITLALSHGSNDAQKGMGVISLALLLFYKVSSKEVGKFYQPGGANGFYVPDWVILICSLAIALGVSFGGWRIMKTLGTKLYKIRPIHGFSAQTCASAVIYLSSLLGYPVSTTQIVSSSILGAGSAQRIGSVRWQVGKQIFLTWLFTIPGSALLSAGIFLLLKRWFG